MRAVDLRLAPAAVLAWVAAWAATGGTGAPALAAACGWLAALAGASVIVLAGLRGATRHRAVTNGVLTGPGVAAGVVTSLVAHVALAAACSLAVVATAAVQTARAATIEDLADEASTARLTGTVASQPEPVPWGSPSSARSVRFVMDVSDVTARGVTTTARAHVAVTWAPTEDTKAGAKSRETATTGTGSQGTGSQGTASQETGSGAPEILGSRGSDTAHGPRFGGVVEVRGGLRPAEPGRPESARLTADTLTVQRSPPAALRLLDRHRDALMAVTADLPPQGRGLVPGAAIGDTTRLPEDLADAMRASSLTHITAVSGGHFAIVIALLTGIAGTLGAPRWARIVLLAVAGAAFVALVRPEPSVLRAAVMAGFALAGIVLGRPAQSVPALAGTVIGLLVADPWLSRSFGFVLSAAATAGLVLLVPPLVARIAPWTGKAFAFALAVPLAAQAACGPVLVLLEPEVSLVSVPANLLATPALVPATVLGLAATVLAPWWPWAAALVAWAASGATWWIAQVALHAAALPGRALPWPGGAAGALLLAVATAAVLALVRAWHPRGWPDAWRRSARSGLRRMHRAVGGSVPGALASGGGTTRGVSRGGGATRGASPGGRGAPGGGTAPVLAGIVVVGVTAGLVVLAVPRVVARSAVPPDWVVAACDVGQGDGLAVRTGPASAVVVDVGPDGDATGRCLDELGVTRVDLLVLSHFHADHVGGLTAVLEGREVRSALVSPLPEPAAGAARTMDELAAADVPVRSPLAGERGAAGDTSWEVLLSGLPGATPGASPGSGAGGAAGEGSGANDASVILLVRVAGLDVVLLGDLEDAGQAALLAETRRRGIADVDVVKVAHHGSRVQSRALAEQLSPAVALVSVGGDNEYGHPTDTALDLYSGVGAAVLRTDECGTFALVVRGGDLAVGGC
ncbi:ComEC/Rec2 family competence protein [Myceligenerans pegani]|uniref:ComEC/Rec2 family competence protein n=1 Tax=Myceligenerans pegani TaxID=2776917 RepID=A0ABR9N258_9MICO|nr:ComEC/Rec2 family competence protein [Myceligenerans sp. TRM 65318]MBE1877741.1 ComEC/Rec2 family competence protein [Myceligenerans sp. TRM 65318]MBE3020012.1 ComEC/Rec2 family competence protein [Myceligenerans sp. TRM 65318]